MYVVYPDGDRSTVVEFLLSLFPNRSSPTGVATPRGSNYSGIWSSGKDEDDDDDDDATRRRGFGEQAGSQRLSEKLRREKHVCSAVGRGSLALRKRRRQALRDAATQLASQK